MAEDYYKTLNVSRSASVEEIQKSYRKLARKYHPDLHADSDDRERNRAKQNFQKVQQAYDVLSDPDKRSMYDQYGEGFDQMGGQNPFAGRGGPGGGAPGGMGGFEDILRQMGGGMEGRPQSGGPRGGMGGFEDILRQMGGGGRGAPRSAPPTKGEDIEQEITIPFAVAVLGGKHQVRFTRPNGKAEAIDVKIPAGIEPSQKIRLRGQGYPNPAGGPAGDLKVLVKISPHPSYTRTGLNLTVTIPITVTEASAGAKIDLPTPHGTVSLSVPPGSSSGKPLRLRGMGIRTEDRSGDLIAMLQIVVPKKISDQDLELLKQLSSDWNSDMRTDLKW